MTKPDSRFTLEQSGENLRHNPFTGVHQQDATQQALVIPVTGICQAALTYSVSRNIIRLDT
ncbi:hypothetical protein PspLS_08506 [Pyricularia sp. CBS 133598]|nr:hypothetical protein PspLS_08506 [Pyricularia sp. CBS 133598]